MKRTFMRQVKEDCQAAEKAGEHVLLLMFGHGVKELSGIELGDGYAKVLKFKEFQSALSKTTAKVTLLTTHYYADRWIFNPDINISAMTNKKLDDPETDEQEESIAELSKVVHKILLSDVDRLGHVHDMSFRAQDDTWSMCWRERTGIPLGRFEERWNQLPDHDADATLLPGDPFNRDPHVTEKQRARYLEEEKLDKEQNLQDSRREFGRYEAVRSALGRRKPSTLFGGSLESMIRPVSVRGPEYINCYKGNDDTGNDGALHNMIRLIQSGQITEQPCVQEVLNSIEYRMNQMFTAEKYLDVMDVPAPDGQQCHEYNANKVLDQVGEKKCGSIQQMIFDRRILFRSQWSNKDGHSTRYRLPDCSLSPRQHGKGYGRRKAQRAHHVFGSKSGTGGRISEVRSRSPKEEPEGVSCLQKGLGSRVAH
ncbi:hypothetical protein ABVK25_005080 [Lepraria finkii]|uniref:Uncharacterized protein n=1 Tax=Lepraria finkii TaxID=1340010 RepID=A0ABR4BA82_9LECA